MLYMNRILETYNVKLFQPLPLRTNIVPKHLILDTAVIIDLFSPDKDEAGNWSRSTQMKYFMPTMNKGLRKLIHKRYDTVTINEYRTSITCCECEGELKNYIKKNGSKVHRLLVCSNCVRHDVKQTVFRNRDTNAAMNIMKIMKSWVEEKEHPLCFQRSSDTSGEIRVTED